ncbi:triple tyrosine motif-containing protein [Clostridium scatologenes]|uniref:Two component regulator three Y domain protein n=1 Tax=Clostridium scatologenes TaxID=1548 RepID=A0A0E3MA55_CLOSL|nr:triple tyrosine motif-containing protein [Clostridium scatologenes]AKA71734.1 Two component regulator three Y domain protein [Clostridium scatologenes]
MNELEIKYNLESPQEKNSKILISINNVLEEKLMFKYMVGLNGIWSTLKDFSETTSVEWVPEEEGKYIIMVQARKGDSQKSFDYVSRENYIIGKVEEKLINNIGLDKYKLNLGEKVNLFVNTNKLPLMFRYWLKIDDKWEIIKDYSPDNTLSWTIKFEGKGEMLVECKNIDSQNNYDDFQTVEFDVMDLKKVEIQDFNSVNLDLIEGNELTFKVETSHEEGRNILYKFIKINGNGETECIQDYSTKRIVSYVESKSGEYRLLCLVKDMYSSKNFDDRAIINFFVKKYKDICIKTFTTDLNSPQLCETVINLKADVIGGKELLYKYIIEGNCNEDSGYIRTNSYDWKTKKPGNYKIYLWVKDKSSEEKYEACECIEFTVDEKSKEPVKINDVIMDKKHKVLINEPIKVKINASGGTDLEFSFIIRREKRVLETIDYDKNNTITFMPKEEGNYQFEARVKDKYSDRKFDCHYVFNLEVFRFIPGEIEYVLFPLKDYYVVGDKVMLNVITQNTSSILVNYVLRINDHKVEETGYTEDKRYSFVPKCSGSYTVEMYAKNKESNRIFDCKKCILVKIHEALPVTNTKIICDRTKFLCNDSATFTVKSEGGKDVLYEFFIMEKGEWTLVQNYSKKNYYTFIPFSKGQYKILVLAKSQYHKGSYEDYDMIDFFAE